MMISRVELAATAFSPTTSWKYSTINALTGISSSGKMSAQRSSARLNMAVLSAAQFEIDGVSAVSLVPVVSAISAPSLPDSWASPGCGKRRRVRKRA